MIPRITEWLTRIQNKRVTDRPVVILSYATSVDGCLSFRKGTPISLSGQKSLEATHLIRAFCDAVLVGSGTVASDNPSLTVRFAKGKNPRPVILDSSLKLAGMESLNLSVDSSLVFCSEEAEKERRTLLTSHGAEVISVPSDARGLDLEAVLYFLVKKNIGTLMVEGGAEVLSSFICSGLWDAAAVTLSPCFLSGYSALGTGYLYKKENLVNHLWLPVGDDMIFLGERDES